MGQSMPCGEIMAVLVTKRVAVAPDVQKVLTDHGCIIRMRLGLHEVSQDYCADEGLILLHLCGTPEERDALAAALEALGGVRIKRLSLD